MNLIVAIWKDKWLSGSETFVRAHADSLRDWSPVCLGYEKLHSPLAKESDVILSSQQGPIEQLKLKLARRGLFVGWVSRAILQSGASVVHVHSASDAMAVRAAVRRAGLPLIVTLHGVDITAGPALPGRRGRSYRRNLHLVFRDSVALVCVSDHIRETALAAGAPPARLHRIYNGVGIYKIGTAARDIDILFVGRLVEKKGVLDLLEALNRLKARDSLRVVIMGDGPLWSQVQSKVIEDQLRVEMRGSVPPSEVVEAMKSARITVVPSKKASNGDTEGLPTVILEASALGSLVVASDHAGAREAVVHERTGLLFTEGNIDGLVALLDRAIDDRQLRSRLADAARAYVAEKFSLGEQALALEALYAKSMRPEST